MLIHNYVTKVVLCSSEVGTLITVIVSLFILFMVYHCTDTYQLWSVNCKDVILDYNGCNNDSCFVY